MMKITGARNKLIKIESFSDQLIANVDNETQDFIADHEINRENIILLKPYAVKDEQGVLYHYIKLVYDEVKDKDEILGGIQEYE